MKDACDGSHTWKCTTCKDERKVSYYTVRILALGFASGVFFGFVLFLCAEIFWHWVILWAGVLS